MRGGSRSRRQPPRGLTPPMSHPGTIIFANAPGAKGWRFFYLVYHPALRKYRLRCQPDGGSRVELEAEAAEVIAQLEAALAASAGSDSEVLQTALAKLRRHAARH